MSRRIPKVPLLVFIVGVAAVGGFPFLTASLRKSNAEGLAIEWAKAMFPGTSPTAICQGMDTDGDSYVSCTVRVSDQRIPLDCYSYTSFAFGNTCREQQAGVRGRGTK
jgi:hypothetical protein